MCIHIKIQRKYFFCCRRMKFVQLARGVTRFTAFLLVRNADMNVLSVFCFVLHMHNYSLLICLAYTDPGKCSIIRAESSQFQICSVVSTIDSFHD